MTTHQRFLRAVVLAAAAGLSTGCYRGSLVTGLRPSHDVREVTWNRPFSVNDAPVAELKEVSGCPGGVARVETARSVFSQLGNLLDGGASAGVHLAVTCAEWQGAASTDSSTDRRDTPPDSSARRGGTQRRR